MPFARHAVITITNENPEKSVRSFYYQIDYSEEALPEKTAYFCAQYRNEFPEKTGKDYLIMETEGEGQYVGTVMSVRSRSPFWFGEGDARFYVDGDKKPTIQGTGTEDYFLMAWGLNENQFPYYGCIYMSQDFEDLGVEYCLYRWHADNPVTFRKSLKHTMEHGHANNRGDCFYSVAYWYQSEPFTDFPALPPAADRVPALKPEA